MFFFKKEIIVFLLFLNGCSNYYVLTTEYVVHDLEEKADIVATSEYKRQFRSVTSIAVQAPEKCSKQSSSEVAIKSSMLISDAETPCAIYMTEIERALVKNGYRVISWLELAKMQSYYSLSPKDAASKLGARAVFVINSMDKGSIQQDAGAKWERRFYNSDSNGQQEELAMVNEKQKSIFLNNLKKIENNLISKKLNVTLNASVLMSDTGDAIWFYNLTHVEKKKDALKNSMHLSCEEDSCQLLDHIHDNPDHLSSGDTFSAEPKTRDDNAENNVWSLLMKEAINDMIQKFASGSTN